MATLVDDYRAAGSYEVEFIVSSGNNQLTSGVYFYALKSGEYFQTKKMIVLR